MGDESKLGQERGTRGGGRSSRKEASTFRVFCLHPRVPRTHLISSLVLTLMMVYVAILVPVKTVPGQEPSEYQVKAVFLLNFMRFVEWPAEAFSDAKAPIVVGLVGEDPFGSAIDQTISGKNIQGRQLTVRRMKWGQNLKECHLLFVGASERKRVAQILGGLKGASVLTVGDTNQFWEQGGVINFVLEGQRVRFDINADAAGQARLIISSKLLSLAKTVKGGQRSVRN